MKGIIIGFILFPSLCLSQPDSPVGRNIPTANRGGWSKIISFLNDSTRHRYCFLTFNAGIGLPVNDYGSIIKVTNNFLTSPYATQISGFANLGFHGNITAGILLTKHLGVVAKIGLDISSVADSILNVEANPTLSSYYRYHSNSDFRIWQYMFGLYGKFKLYKNSFFLAQAMMGLVIANYPSYTLRIGGGPAEEIMTYTFRNSNGLGYSCSMGFENMLTRTIGLVSTLSYTATEASYPSVTSTLFGINFTQNTPIYMSIGSIQVTAGINFHI